MYNKSKEPNVTFAIINSAQEEPLQDIWSMASALFQSSQLVAAFLRLPTDMSSIPGNKYGTQAHQEYNQYMPSA